MIAFTNHALDHMLASVLDANITKKLVRLGRRSNDERVGQYSIETLEMAKDRSRLDRAFNSRRELKSAQENIAKLMDNVLHKDLENDSDEIVKYLSTFHPEHYENLANPPVWLTKIRELLRQDEDDQQGKWLTADRKGKAHVQDQSHYAFWKECTDLAFVDQVSSGMYFHQNDSTPEQMASQNRFSLLPTDMDADNERKSPDSPSSDDGDSTDSEDIEPEEIWKIIQHQRSLDPEPSKVDAAVDVQAHLSLQEILATQPPTLENDTGTTTLLPADFHDVNGFFNSIGLQQVPYVSLDTTRSLESLLDNGDVWGMNAQERKAIHQFWVQETRKELSETYLNEFERLRDIHADKLQESNEMKEEVKLYIYPIITCPNCLNT